MHALEGTGEGEIPPACPARELQMLRPLTFPPSYPVLLMSCA